MPNQHGSTRVTQLDGLRGLAALVVVACHAISTLPWVGRVVSNDRSSRLTSPEMWAVFSPLHVFWNGTPAVHVFFVLSGFVLILPFTKSLPGRSWAPYYAKRLLRLYLPAWAALALAVVLMVLIPRTPSPLQSPWADMYVTTPDPGQVFRDALLLLNASTINTPLWTLRWEVAFSLLLPLYVFLALRWRRFWHLKLAIALGLAVIGGVFHIEALTYMPIFAIGSILSAERERIRELTSAWPRVIWLLLAAVGLYLANAEWISPEPPIPGIEAVITVGATLIVLVFLLSGSAKKLGDTSLAQWLGRISFSLYLVHLPIILAAATLLRGVSLPLGLVLGVAASFGVAELFFRYVERPAHRLSVAAGRAVERRITKGNRAAAVAATGPADATSNPRPGTAPSAADVRQAQPQS
ncbi:acyltransferase family protein [Arthrobacter sp. NPDC057259]|uniref:acyltransferase family protein n=1 Tax=Arthrobacter sp. NPDC057259 TaxID=3346073 RepID=UPI003625EF6E